jgi:hypothetical protein
MCNLYNITTSQEAVRQLFSDRSWIDRAGNVEPGGRCQTNLHQSQLGQGSCPLGRAEAAPFVESGGAVELEVRSTG